MTASFAHRPHGAAQSLLASVCLCPGEPADDTTVEAAARDADWLCTAAERTMIGGLLWGSLTTAQRALLPGPCQERLRATHMAIALRWQAYRRLVLSSVDRLAQAGIPVAVLKGCALLLMQAYPDPGQRMLADLDVIVPEDQLDAAQELLGPDASYIRERRHRIHHLGEIVMPGEAGVIEVHGCATHLRRYPQTADPFADSRTITVDNRAVTVPDPVNLWLHLASHGLRHPPQAWPRMAADLARVQSSPVWSAGFWPTIWETATKHASSDEILLAAAMSVADGLPVGLTEAGPNSAEVALACRRAQQAWCLATELETLRFGPWAQAWVRGPRYRRRLLSAYVLPLPAMLADRNKVSPSRAFLLYPAFLAGRWGKLITSGLAWRRALRATAPPGGAE